MKKYSMNYIRQTDKYSSTRDKDPFSTLTSIHSNIIYFKFFVMKAGRVSEEFLYFQVPISVSLNFSKD